MKKFVVILVAILSLLFSAADGNCLSAGMLKYSECVSIYGGSGTCVDRATAYYRSLGYSGTLTDMEMAYLGDLGYSGTMWDRWNAFLGAQGRTGTLRGRFAGSWSFGDTFYATFTDPANPLTISKGTGSFTFTRAHDATHTATYVHPETGLVTVADNNQLRIEADGALIEGARTNLLKYSEQFDHVAGGWGKLTATVDADNTIGPDGTLSAEKIGNLSYGSVYVYQQVAADNGTRYEPSIWIKRISTAEKLSIINPADPVHGQWDIDLAQLPDAWIRITRDTTGVTIVAEFDGVNDACGMQFGELYNVATLSFYVFGAQLEAGSDSSSYIPTVSSAMVRNADSLTGTVSGNASGTEGTFSATVKWSAAVGTGDHIVFDLGGAGQPLYRRGVNQDSAIYDGTSEKFGDAMPRGVSTRVATRWGASEKGISVNGGAVSTGLFDGDMNAAANFAIGSYEGTLYFMFGHIKDLRIWNRALTDAEMQAVTQ